MKPFRSILPPRLIELSLVVAVLAGAVNIYQKWRFYGYLPSPFVFDTNDTFMDWFNTALYAHNSGAYDVWRTIYAPLSFIFLKIFGNPACYRSSPFDARDCDVVGIVSILVTWALCWITAGYAFFRTDRSTALMRSVAFTFSLPLLYALERGNLIMVSFIPFALLFGGLARSKSAMASTAALIINFKSYLLFPMGAFAVKREWRTLEICGLATIFLYLVTLMLMGSGTPFEIKENLDIWFRTIASNVWDQVYYSTSYAPFLEFDNKGYPIRDFVEMKYIDTAKAIIPPLLLSSRLIVLLTVAASWFQPQALTKHRIALLILMQSFVGQSPGGYGYMFIVFLVFMERWESRGTSLAIVFAYFLSIPTDYILANIFVDGRQAWLSGRYVYNAIGISVGALIRPGLFQVVIWSITLDSLGRIHRAFRLNRPATRIIPAQTVAAA